MRKAFSDEIQVRQRPVLFEALGFTDVEVELLTKAAKACNMTPAAYIRLAALQAANRLADRTPASTRGMVSDPWDVRQMKNRMRPKLQVIRGGKT